MTSRKSLSKLFHMNEQQAKIEYENRFNSDSAIHFPLSISGNPCFMVYTKEIGNRISGILEKNAELSKMSVQVECKTLLQENFLLDEIQMNNEIEDIYSSRKLLKQAWKEPSNPEKRFRGLVKQYSLILNPDHNHEIITSKDIREIYDLLLLDDIRIEAPTDVPDGKLFRKGPVYIGNKIKTVHRGVDDEEQIISMLDEGLSFIRNSEESLLIRVAFFHFLFGYVHPFYDGNGRTNRYISTVLLEDKFDLLGIFQLSYMIRHNRNDYYKVFKEVENVLNRGEMTDFVLFFLQMLDQSMDRALNILRDKEKEYKAVLEWVNQFDSETDRRLLNSLLNVTVFSWQGKYKKDLADDIRRSENTVTSIIKKLGKYIYKERDGKYFRYSLNRFTVPGLVPPNDQ